MAGYRFTNMLQGTLGHVNLKSFWLVNRHLTDS